MRSCLSPPMQRLVVRLFYFFKETILVVIFGIVSLSPLRRG